MWNFTIVLSELKRAKKSQRGLAEYLGVPEQRVTDWKSGRIKRSWTSYIPKIAEYIGVPAATFDDEAKDNLTPLNWPRQFRAALAGELACMDTADVFDSGVNIEELSDIVNGGKPLTFEAACSIADALGLSLDAILGRETEKKPAPENEDKLDAEVYDLLIGLSPEKMEAAKTYLRFLKSQEGNL